MSEPEKTADIQCDRLRRTIALTIAFDEQLIGALAVAAAVLRESDDPTVTELDRAIRTHRIGILKQRAILGAAGIDV